MSDRQAHKNILDRLYEGRAPVASKVEVHKKVGKAAVGISARQPRCLGEVVKGTENCPPNTCKALLDRPLNKQQQSLREQKNKAQPVQQLEQRYGQLRLNPVDHSVSLEPDTAPKLLESPELCKAEDEMPGVKRPAETLVKTIIGGDGQVPSVENPDATATIELAQQTPKQKTRSFSQRQVAFVDLTADDSDEPGQQDCASADDASPMSIARSFTDQVEAQTSMHVSHRTNPHVVRTYVTYMNNSVCAVVRSVRKYRSLLLYHYCRRRPQEAAARRVCLLGAPWPSLLWQQTPAALQRRAPAPATPGSPDPLASSQGTRLRTRWAHRNLSMI